MYNICTNNIEKAPMHFTPILKQNYYITLFRKNKKEKKRHYIAVFGQRM